MSRLIKMSVFLIVSALLSGNALAGTLDNIKLALHLEPHSGKAHCTTNAPTEFGCNNYLAASNLVVNGNTNTSYDMYIAALDVPVTGIAGMEFGLSYNGNTAAYTTYLCADQEFAGEGWPHDNGVNTITWIGCQNTVDPTDPQGEVAAVAYAIYIYAYSTDTICITPKSNSGVLGAADCAAGNSSLLVQYPLNMGCVGLGLLGFSPCEVFYSPVEETTWGAIKSQFADGN